MKIEFNDIVKTINIQWLRVYDGAMNTVDYRDRTVFQFPGYPDEEHLIWNGQKIVTGCYYFHIKKGSPLWDIPPGEIERLIEPENVSFIPANINIGQINAISSIIIPASSMGQWNTGYAFFTVEDAYQNGRFHEQGYQRIGMGRIQSPYKYQLGVVSLEIIGEHWQNEDFCRTRGSLQNRYNGEPVPFIQEPAGVYGIGSPQVFPRGEYWYMVYQRLSDYRMMNWNPYYRMNDGYPPGIATGTIQSSAAGLCVARSETLESGWMKYYQGDFTEPLDGGLDTCLTEVDCFFPKIHWNTFLNRYICVAQTSIQASYRQREGIMIMLSSKDLIDWQYECELPIRDGYYPSFIDRYTNSCREIGEKAVLIYGRNTFYDVPRFTPTMAEVKFIK